MSSTRRADQDADPDDAPERHLSNIRLRGLGIGMHIVARVARVLPPNERDCMIWLAGYCRLCDLTGEQIAQALSLPQQEIRESLTNPAHARELFVERVSALRKSFNEELESRRPIGERNRFDLPASFDDALRLIASTSIARKIENAVKMGSGSAQVIEIFGPARIGKSIAGRREFLKNLHRAAWLLCPRAMDERQWLNSLSEALGMKPPTCFKKAEIVPKILACLGRGRIEMLFIDEGQRLLGTEPDASPYRLEYLRDWLEQLGVSIFILGTKQFTESLANLTHAKWAKSQWTGRAQMFHLPNRMTAADLAAVARHHAPDASDDAVAQLVSEAMSGEGFCGSIVAAINRARFREGGDRLTLTAIAEAQRQLHRAERDTILATGKPVPFKRPRGVRGPAAGDSAGGSPEPPGVLPPAAVGA